MDQQEQIQRAPSARKGRRNAAIVAATVEVLCPHCAEPQPNPDNGGYPWTPEEVSAEQGAKVCVSCDEPFRLVAQSHALINPIWEPPAEPQASAERSDAPNAPPDRGTP